MESCLLSESRRLEVRRSALLTFLMNGHDELLLAVKRARIGAVSFLRLTGYSHIQLVFFFEINDMNKGCGSN